MKTLTEKMLKSGLVDKHMAQLLERWGHLPEGASELVNDKALENSTKEQLTAMVEDIAAEVEKDRGLRETTLDLNTMRWPVRCYLCKPGQKSGIATVVGLVDRMNRYYFKADEVRQDWFVPGYTLERWETHPHSTELQNNSGIVDTILEVSPLYVGSEIVAIQVSTK